MRPFMIFTGLTLLLAACTPAPVFDNPTITATVSAPPPTITRLPTAVVPTETPSLTAADITRPYSEWSAEAQAQFRQVLTDPDNATVEQKTAFDAAIIAQWHQVLRDAGVGNADTLQGNALRDAIVEYAHVHNIYEAWIPISMIRGILTDSANLIPYGEAPASTGPFENPRTSWFGFGVESHFDLTMLHTTEKLITPINFFGEILTRGGSMDPVTVPQAYEGNVALRFFLPGADPNGAQGLLIKMIDTTGTTRYALGRIEYNGTLTAGANDTCSVTHGGMGGYEACAPNTRLPQTYMTFGLQPRVHRNATREEMDYLMSQNEMHIEIHVRLDMNPSIIVTDGMIVINFIHIWSTGSFSP